MRLSHIKKAMAEFNDEAALSSRGIKPFISNHVNLSKYGITHNQSFEERMICHHVEANTNIAIFLFEIKDQRLFFEIFPRSGYTNQCLKNDSLGEIDAIQSFSTNQIIDIQNREIITYNQNFFTGYTLKTYLKLIKLLYDIFRIPYKFEQINILPDTTHRIIRELEHNQYRKKYLKYKNKYLLLKKE